MKKSMIIGKRQLILAGLICVLGLAVFLNWQFASTDSDMDLTAVLNGSKYLGDAQYVNQSATVEQTTTSAQENNFFEQARTERQKARDSASESLKEILNDIKSDQAAKTAAAEKAAQIAKNIELENAAETLIKAKGFSECVVILADDKASVIVKSDGLLPSETVQINDIITSQTKVSLENIKIIEVK